MKTNRPCCGKKRSQLINDPIKINSPNSFQPELKVQEGAFIYLDHQSTAIKSPISGKTYYFEQKGHKYFVDLKDIGYLSARVNLLKT